MSLGTNSFLKTRNLKRSFILNKIIVKRTTAEYITSTILLESELFIDGVCKNIVF